MIKTSSNPEITKVYLRDPVKRTNSLPFIKKFYNLRISPRSPRYDKEKTIRLIYRKDKYDFLINDLIKRAPNLARLSKDENVIVLDDCFTETNQNPASLASQFLLKNAIDWNQFSQADIYTSVRTLLSESLLSIYIKDTRLSKSNLMMVLACLDLIHSPSIIKECSRFIKCHINHFDIETLENLFLIGVKLKSLSIQLYILNAIDQKNLIEEIACPEVRYSYETYSSILPLIEFDTDTISIEGSQKNVVILLAKIRELIFSKQSDLTVWITLTKKCSLKHLKSLLKEIEHPHCAITHIYFSAVDYLADEHANLLLHSLQKNSSISSIKFCGQITSLIMPSLMAMLRTKNKAMNVDLSFTQIGDYGFQSLRRMYEKQILQKLDLSYCGITSIGLKHFSRLSMANLNLSGNKLGKHGAACLAKGLQKTRNLTHLNLSETDLENQGLEIIMKALSVNTTLISLCLNTNSFDSEAINCISTYLMENNSLRFLELGKNNMKDQGTCMIASGLRKNNTLIHLNLSHNGITSFGANKLSAALRVNKCLQSLNMIGNNCMQSDKRALSRILHNPCTPLNTLYF